MIALEVSINGHRYCLAGVGDNGVLSATVNWVGGRGRESRTFMTIGGLDSSAHEYLSWNKASIDIGAEVLVRVVDVETVDRPDDREATEPPDAVKQFRSNLQSLLEDLTADQRRTLLTELIEQLKNQPPNESPPIR